MGRKKDLRQQFSDGSLHVELNDGKRSVCLKIRMGRKNFDLLKSGNLRSIHSNEPILGTSL